MNQQTYQNFYCHDGSLATVVGRKQRNGKWGLYSILEVMGMEWPNMKKFFLLTILFFLAIVANGQTIQSSNYSTKGYIRSDGTIQNSSYKTVGYIRNDKIQDSSYRTIGYIRNGTIQDSSYRTVGYVKDNGTVQNSSYRTLGYIKDNGTVQNSSYSTLGYARGVKKEWAAVVFFFFKFN